MPTPMPADRMAVLEQRRMLKMAQSAHAYVRGSTVRFYEWLSDAPVVKNIPVGPAIWICGDCHLGNLGALADSNGDIDVEIRDFDQAVIGNPAHDLIRLGLSLATAARGSDLPGVTTAQMIETMVDGYGAALRDPVDGDSGPEPGAVRSVRREAIGRRWRHLAKERLDGVKPDLPIGKRFWALDDTERTALKAVLNDVDVANLVRCLGSTDPDAALTLVDAAYWVKGCSSLGLLRFAAIVAVARKKGSPGYSLIDLKEAVAPIAPIARGAKMPKDNGARVVAAAKALSPHLGTRMTHGRLLGRSMFIRELAPQDLKLEVEQFNESQAVKAARYLAFVVGKAHARQLDEAARREWSAVLDTGRRGRTDTPSWLWDAVVWLAGRHEAGYLEHCRRYALAA